MADIRDIFGESGASPQRKRPTERNSLFDLQSALLAKGLLVKNIILDGNIHRVPTRDKPNSVNGWYIGTQSSDGNFICSYGDWRDAHNKSFYSSFTDKAAEKEFKERSDKAWNEASVEERRAYREANIAALKKYEAADSDNVHLHPYIEAKGIKPLPGMKVSNAQIMIPLQNLEKQFVGMQLIDANGLKKFSFKAKPKEGFAFIGTNPDLLPHDSKIIVCEGFATGASLYEATGLPVVIVWSCTFAPHGVKALRSHTQAEIIVCLDNDKSGAGQTAAQKICEEVENCIDRTPQTAGADYNDIKLMQGVAEVRRQVLRERFGLRGNTARQFVTTPPEREWLVANTLEAGKAGIMAGVGGIGKSMEALRLAMMIAQGEGQWMGNEIINSGNVVYISAEDDALELHRRVMDIDPEKKRLDALHDVYFLSVPDQGKPITFMKDGEDGLTMSADADELVKELETIEDLAMVIIDPIQAFVTAEISKSNEAGQLWATWAATIASRFGCGVMSIHHMSKDALRGDQNALSARAAIRGASSLVDGHRFAFALYNATETEVADTCTLYGMHPPDASRVVKFAVVKANAGEIDRSEKLLFRKGGIFEPVLGVVAGGAGSAWDD